MKKQFGLLPFIFIMFYAFISMQLTASESTTTTTQDVKKTALLVIDVQDFYFPGGSMPLVQPEAAARNIQRLLGKFRNENQPVIFVRHNAPKGAEIHRSVIPFKNERVFSKDEVNCFKGTGLLDYLRQQGIKRLVICGMQTHMCVEAAVRAAHDEDFDCILVHDACATRDLTFAGKTVSAADAHTCTLSTLSAYAQVIDTSTFLEKY